MHNRRVDSGADKENVSQFRIQNAEFTFGTRGTRCNVMAYKLIALVVARVAFYGILLIPQQVKPVRRTGLHRPR